MRKVILCPSQAQYYGTREEIERMRPDSVPVNSFKLGKQKVKGPLKTKYIRIKPIL